MDGVPSSARVGSSASRAEPSQAFSPSGSAAAQPLRASSSMPAASVTAAMMSEADDEPRSSLPIARTAAVVPASAASPAPAPPCAAPASCRWAAMLAQAGMRITSMGSAPRAPARSRVRARPT